MVSRHGLIIVCSSGVIVLIEAEKFTDFDKLGPLQFSV
jgi:hypothetical protein